MEMLRLENINFTYPNQNKKALNSINFKVNEGEFIVVCGESGCGKSTLLRHLKPELKPHGKGSGDIYFENDNIKDLSLRKTSSYIGYVLQNPDAQIVTDKVWHELAFGLENLGLDIQTIRRRVAEIASFFGIQGLFRKNVEDLSGGQKQLLNLASIMVMQPKLLILDEPTSQLDPIASKDFIDILVRINKELSTTIIMTEHNLEEVYEVANKVLVMENGEVLDFDTPRNVIENIYNINKEHRFFKSIPSASKIYTQLKLVMGNEENCPLTVKEGKGWLLKNIPSPEITKLNNYKSYVKVETDVAIELKDVYFKYKKSEEVIVRNLSLKVNKGEIYTILGGNGTGKTTTLSIISKQIKVQKGKVIINGLDIKKYDNASLFRNNLALLPQNPQSLFVFETLKEDLEETLKLQNIDKSIIKDKILDISKRLNISHLLSQHPYDLSGGEMQRAAIAKVMLLEPKILLLDEPTKGLDVYSKEEIGEILLDLKKSGITIIMVTHDIEFSASYSDRCAMFFDGYIVSEGNPIEFFSGNNFYTTSSNRISRGIFEDTLTCKDVIDLCKVNLVSQVSL